MGIKTKTYSKVEFLSAMEAAQGSPLKFFSIRYPSDPRCSFSLRVHYELEDGSCDYSWYEAEDPKTVGYLLRRKGRKQEHKVTLRSPERGNRIVATVYTGEDDARWIVEAVNAYGKREVG